MKRMGIIVAIALMAVVGIFVQQSSALGHFVANENGASTIAASETIDSSAYMAGEKVVVDGTVNGDLYCAASDVVINGTVNGDVLCGAATLVIGGVVHGDVRAAGSSITLKGLVDGSATLAGSTVTIDSSADIAGDLTGGASELVLNGTVGRDMLLGAGTAVISGTVGRDVQAGIATLTFGKGGVVRGDLQYQSDVEASIPQGAVLGRTEFTKAKENSSADTNPVAVVVGISAAFVLFALVVTLALPKFVHEASSLSGRMVLIAFLTGFAVVSLTPVLAFILMVTVIGIPVAMTLVIAVSLLFMLSGVFAAYYIGGLVLQKRATNALLVTLVGALILGVALWIPVLNIVVWFIAICTGVGMQTVHLRHQFSHQPYKITN